MQKLTIKQYATKYKLSIYNVIKMTKSGELNIETVEENGKEKVYILLEDLPKQKLKKEPKQEKSYKNLQEENDLLKEEIKRLKKALKLCKQKD